MITLSNFALAGIVEVFLAFILSVLVLVFYNRRLYKRTLFLSGLIRDLKKAIASRKTNTKKDKAQIPPSLPQIDYLTEQIDLTEKLVEEKSTETSSIENTAPVSTAQIAVLRLKFLQAEKAAYELDDNDDKWRSISSSLSEIIAAFQSSIEEPTSNDDLTTKLTENWQELCESALTMWQLKSAETEDNLISLFQVINSELGFDQLDIPTRLPKSELMRTARNETVQVMNTLKESAGENKKLIASLLELKDAAESEVSIKIDELQKLQRFLTESEVCLKQIEDELEELREALRLSKEDSNGAEDTEDMKKLIQNFAKESSELLSCIATLESENSELRSQLNDG